MPRLLPEGESALAENIGELVYGAAIARREEGEERSFEGCSFETIGLCFLRIGYLDRHNIHWVNEPEHSNLMVEGQFRDFTSVEPYIEQLYNAIVFVGLAGYARYIQDLSYILEEGAEINESNIVQLHSLLLHKHIYRRVLDLYSIIQEENWSRTDYQRHPSQEVTAPGSTNDMAPMYQENVNTMPGENLDWGAEVRGDRISVQPTRQTLGADSPAISRPYSHGQNDEAHNLDIKYRNCYVLVAGVVGKVITFQRNRESGVIQIRYLAGNPETSAVRVKEILETYEATKHILDFPTLGWVKNDNLCTYLEIIPGAYLRGVSEHNTYSAVTIMGNKITREGNYRPDISALIPELVVRKFDNISLGLKEKYNNIVITPEACLFLGKSPKGEHEKYFLMIASMCVGEHLKSIPAIKLYKQYTPLKSFIETVINYETK